MKEVGSTDTSPGKSARAEQEAMFFEEVRWLEEHGDEYHAKLLQNIKARLPRLEKLLAQAEDHWGLEDGIYRFYHQSFKVYRLQSFTKAIQKELQELLPDRPLNDWFARIVEDGTGTE